MQKLLYTLATAIAVMFIVSGFRPAEPAADKVTDTDLTIIKGELLQGIECGVLEECGTGTIWVLTQVPNPFGPGDIVKVGGRVIDGAFCFSPGQPGLRVKRMAYADCQ